MNTTQFLATSFLALTAVAASSAFAAAEPYDGSYPGTRVASSPTYRTDTTVASARSSSASGSYTGMPPAVARTAAPADNLQMASNRVLTPYTGQPAV
ncbi:hypothetical protein [Rhodoferax sp.]|uniref:hypothetical protein n=1 Tax=Rhodoferax sp. TaxID=50421 RepID=UPI00374CA125